MTHPIGKATLILLLCLASNLFTAEAFASLRVVVDRTEITDADLLKLTIRLENATTSTSPNFASLERDFEIVQRAGPNQSSRISIVNGRQTSESYVTWELRLRPKRLGTLTIPAFQFGNDTSSAIPIRVTQQSEAMKRKMSQLVFFETEVDQDATYVQGQILYTVKLYYVENISGDFPAPPSIPNAVVETIENERRFDAITNGRRYYVLEKRYGIYPQKSGTLTIPGQTFSGYRVGPGFFSTREPILARSEPHRIEVKAKPASFSGEHWLPATDVKLTASWAGAEPNFVVGEPVNRSIVIEAKGVAASLLPELEVPDIQGVKMYQDPPEESQSLSQEGISAKQSVVIGLVPTEPGVLQLPEIRLPWWNTAEDRLEVAVIPAESYEVAPSPDAAVMAPQTSATPVPVAAIGGETNLAPSDPFWQYLSLALFIAWLATALLWLTAYLLQKRRANAEPRESASELQTEKEVFNHLLQACKSNNAGAAQRLLIDWAQYRYGPVQSLQELSGKANSQELKRAINDLEQALYAPSASGNWQGRDLIPVLKSLSTSPARPTRTSRLASLHPS